MLASSLGISRVTDTWRVTGRPPMEATKTTEGRKESSTARLRSLVWEAKGAGVRVDSLLVLLECLEVHIRSNTRCLQSDRYGLVERFQRKKQLRARRNLCQIILSQDLPRLYGPTYLEIEAVCEVDIVCSIDPAINFRVQSRCDA